MKEIIIDLSQYRKELNFSGLTDYKNDGTLTSLMIEHHIALDSMLERTITLMEGMSEIINGQQRAIDSLTKEIYELKKEREQ